jgi:hypothetical protein
MEEAAAFLTHPVGQVNPAQDGGVVVGFTQQNEGVQPQL